MKSIQTLLRGYIKSKTKISGQELENHVCSVLGQAGYWQQGGYRQFCADLEQLVEEGVLGAIKSSGLNGRQPALYQRYRVVTQRDEPELALKQRLLTWYHPLINTAYYLQHKRDLIADQSYLEKLDVFLKVQPDLEKIAAMTANERSFQVFGEEKWLLSKQGKNFCQRVGIDLQALRCYPTCEPFFYYRTGQAEELKVLIVENKDTFFSLKELMRQGLTRWGGYDFGLLIYGEGRKIQKSFGFYQEVEEVRDLPAEFFYFGDLDAEGISIWYDFKRQYEVEIKPFVYFYQELMRRYETQAGLVKAGQRLSAEAVGVFLSYFSDGAAAGIANLLSAGRYLPQEGLNYVVLQELAGR